MSPTTPPLSQRQPLHDAVLAYVKWREECAAVRDAYGRWSSAAREDTVPGHAAYCAALDREEAAARTYAELSERTRRMEAGSDEAPIPLGSG